MEQPVRSRRPHTKSRLGCQQCKARRIKCDQVYPTCGHCYRTQKPCSLRTTGPSTGVAGGPVSPSSSVSSGMDTYDAMDLYLMHTFTAETSQTLATSATVTRVWQHAMPRRAVEQPMLMHGLLAIAGLHRFFLITDNEQEKHNMLSRSAAHQQRGIELYRAQIAETVKNDTRRDMEQTCLAFAAMLLTVTLGQMKADPNPTGLDALISVLDHMRSIGTLLSSASNHLDSDIAPMFGLPLSDEPPSTPDFSDVLNALQDLPRVTTDPVHIQTIHILQGVLSTPITSALEFYLLGFFAVTVSEEFHSALRNHDISALRIFHLYCKALAPLHQLWFFEDWSAIVDRELAHMAIKPESHPT